MGRVQNRRDVLRTAGAFMALAPMAALAGGTAFAKSSSIGAVPSRRFVLTRELERGLGDGKAILVRREWQCRLVSLGAGARVEGSQSAVDVQAPPLLSQIAELEKKRQVAQFLPADLDRSGRIVRAGNAGASGSQLNSAVQIAAQIFAQMPSHVSASQAREFLSMVSQNAANLVSRVPPNLFFPGSGEETERRTIDLPNGETGEIVIAIRSRADPETGILIDSERMVTTRVSGSERISRESWNLT